MSVTPPNHADTLGTDPGEVCILTGGDGTLLMMPPDGKYLIFPIKKHRLYLSTSTRCASRGDHLPKSVENQHSLMPILQRPLSLFFLPSCRLERPSRVGNSNSIGTLSTKIHKVGSADQNASPMQILARVSAPSGTEETFEEVHVRARLGFESQRQWPPNAILRTSPAMLGFFSVVTLLAHHLSRSQPIPTQTAAYYHKTQPTFSDVIAFVRQYLWMNTNYPNSPAQTRLIAVPEPIVQGLMDTLCDAA